MLSERLAADSQVSASIVASAALIEHLRAPQFRYGIECLGPRDCDRDRVIELRRALAVPLIAHPYSYLKAARIRARQRRELQSIALECKWVEDFHNLVTTAGGNDLLTQYFKGSGYTAAWFVGLVDNASFSAIAAGDTAGSHSGWTESTAYSNANRPTLTLGTAASKSIDNSASKAQFNINATATLNGAFTITNNTKGGTTGTLYSAGSFAATRGVINGDTLNVQVTLTV